MWKCFVPADVVEYLVGFHHFAAKVFIRVFEFVEGGSVESAMFLVVNWPVGGVDARVDELIRRRALLPV